MPEPQLPSFVLIGHPDLPKGPGRLTCSACQNRFPAQLSTIATLAQLPAAQKPVIACWDCLKDVLAARPDLARALPPEFIGNKQARARWGLDN